MEGACGTSCRAWLTGTGSKFVGIACEFMALINTSRLNALRNTVTNRFSSCFPLTFAWMQKLACSNSAGKILSNL